VETFVASADAGDVVARVEERRRRRGYALVLERRGDGGACALRWTTPSRARRPPARRQLGLF
jgi:hypothetical protein